MEPPSGCLSSQVRWVQTARFKDGSTHLLKGMEPQQMQPIDISADMPHTLEIDRSKTYQELVGFGGAFTEASAINWHLLSKEDQEKARADPAL